MRFVARSSSAAQGIAIPVGMYWVDGFIGAAAMFDLDPLGTNWDKWRIAVVPAATWDSKTSPPWSLAGWRRHFNRRVQQTRGRLQNAAIYETVKSQGFEALTECADDLALEWVRREPATRQPAFYDVFGHLAIRRMHHELVQKRGLVVQAPWQGLVHAQGRKPTSL